MTRVTVGSLRPSVQTSNRGTASEATQAQVNTGTADGVYVSPKTLAEKVEVITASGTDTYTATIPGTLTSGRRVYIKFTNANTGASTLNGTSIKKSVSTELSSGDIAAGEIKLLAYDGTNFQVVGGSGASTTPSINVEGGTERKISAMTAITAAQVADNDVFPIVDVSDTTDAATGTNKKIAHSQLFPFILPRGSTLNRLHTNSNVCGNTTTAALSSTLMRAHPIYIPFHTTIDRIAIEITTGTSGRIRLGIYGDDGNGTPSTLLVDGGELTVTAPAVLTSTISLTVTPGLYWLAYSTDTANTARGVTLTQTYAIGFPSTIGNATMANAVQATRSYAALPDPFTTPITYGNFSATPIIGVRFT